MLSAIIDDSISCFILLIVLASGGYGGHIRATESIEAPSQLELHMKAILCDGIPTKAEPTPLLMRFMEKVEGEVQNTNDGCSDTPTYLGPTGPTGTGPADYDSD